MCNGVKQEKVEVGLGKQRKKRKKRRKNNVRKKFLQKELFEKKFQEFERKIKEDYENSAKKKFQPNISK